MPRRITSLRDTSARLTVPPGRNLLELQWALQPRFYAVDFDMDGLFERAVNVAVAGRRVKTPSPEDLLLVLSVHAAKHVWGRLIWLCDIVQILKLGNLNWDWVRAHARGIWDRADCARHAVAGEPAAGDSDSRADGRGDS